MKKALIWLTNDLRTIDHPLIEKLKRKNIPFEAIYFDNPFEMDELKMKFTISQHKVDFEKNAISLLENQLKSIDQKLIVSDGNPVDLIPKMALKHNCDRVYTTTSYNPLNVSLHNEVEHALLKFGIFLDKYHTHLAIGIDNLPFPISKSPDTFKSYLKETKDIELEISEVVMNPDLLLNFNEIVTEIENNQLPELLPYDNYLNNNFSKFLPFLSIGLLSPRMLFHELIKHNPNLADVSNAVKVFKQQLYKLDYIYLNYAKAKQKSFEQPEISKSEEQLIVQWIEGKTGNEFVNAIMHKLRSLGNISLTSKKYAIMYYLKVLKLPAFYGHWYFENQLKEYEPSLNHFLWTEALHSKKSSSEILDEIEYQTKKLDPELEFVSYWS